MVWVNGKQNLGVVNFVQQSVDKRPRRPETGNKDGFEEMEYEFPFGIFRPENRTTFLDVPLLPEIFRWNDQKRRVPFAFQPDFPETSRK